MSDQVPGEEGPAPKGHLVPGRGTAEVDRTGTHPRPEDEVPAGHGAVSEQEEGGEGRGGDRACGGDLGQAGGSDRRFGLNLRFFVLFTFGP